MRLVPVAELVTVKRLLTTKGPGGVALIHRLVVKLVRDWRMMAGSLVGQVRMTLVPTNVMARLLTRTVADAVLLVATVSGSFTVTLAVLVKTPLVVVIAMMVVVTVAVAGRMPMLQVTTPLLRTHVPPVIWTDSGTKAAGMVSVRITPVAVKGPLLVTRMV